MQNILVYATPFEIENGKWGYKWIGVYNGKRFIVIQNPYVKNIFVDQEKQEYIFTTYEQRKLLPLEIQKIAFGSLPLPNKYFILESGKKNMSIEIVVSLIEEGYDIKCIELDKMHYKYIETKTKNIIAEILEDNSVLWKGYNVI